MVIRIGSIRAESRGSGTPCAWHGGARRAPLRRSAGDSAGTCARAASQDLDTFSSFSTATGTGTLGRSRFPFASDRQTIATEAEAPTPCFTAYSLSAHLHVRHAGQGGGREADRGVLPAERIAGCARTRAGMRSGSTPSAMKIARPATPTGGALPRMRTDRMGAPPSCLRAWSASGRCGTARWEGAIARPGPGAQRASRTVSLVQRLAPAAGRGPRVFIRSRLPCRVAEWPRASRRIAADNSGHSVRN